MQEINKSFLTQFIGLVAKSELGDKIRVCGSKVIYSSNNERYVLKVKTCRRAPKESETSKNLNFFEKYVCELLADNFYCHLKICKNAIIFLNCGEKFFIQIAKK